VLGAAHALVPTACSGDDEEPARVATATAPTTTQPTSTGAAEEPVETSTQPVAAGGTVDPGLICEGAARRAGDRVE
jgi:hypothetical protein